jgi:alpha-galactosidase
MKISFFDIALRGCAISLLMGSLFASAAPTSDETTTMDQWIGKAFGPTNGSGNAAAAAPAAVTPGIRVIREDFGVLGINQSCIKTPIRIGTQSFAHGLGVNSVAELEVTLPPGATHFDAQVGIDNNSDTAGTKGSSEFIVEADGKQLFKSAVLRGGGEPVAVSTDLTGAKILTLKVTDGGDGPGWDQGDWADATITLTNGGKVMLNELPVLDGQLATRSPDDLPFSFIYGGKSSRDLLKTWPQTVTEAPSPGPGRTLTKITWTDPQSGLEVRCELTKFSDSPAADWVVWLTNNGTANSPIIEKLLALDMVTPAATPSLVYSNGSTASQNDYVPNEKAITPYPLNLSAVDGRSSGGIFPFFNLHDKELANGLMLAIGWSGQWESSFRTISDLHGAKLAYLSAGQQALRLTLKPGETIRTPRILLIRYAGSDQTRGHNLLRQTLLAHYVPRVDGKIDIAPVTANTWFTYNSGSGVTEANQLAAIARMAQVGVEDYWLDAGWYGTGEWYKSVGSWNTREKDFPNGLKVLSDAAHQDGMKMIVWFEPERVQKNTTIAQEHPEFVHEGPAEGLFKLDDPTARKWMTDLLADHLSKDGIDVLRIDYNLNPLSYWRNADTPDRQGWTENQYMQGLYTMWDDLRTRFPQLMIDDCASGGRRIDLETVSRSIPLWRSDRPCDGKANPTWDQAETAGISLWVPESTEGTWGFDPYTARSVATVGAAICADLLNPKFATADVERAIAEMKDLRPLWLGDYYPLTAIDTDDSHWMGWQFDRPDMNAGFVMVFRRPKVSETSFTAQLHGLDPAANYEVLLVDEKKTVTVSGKDLESYQVDLPQAASCVLLKYRKL